MKGTIDHLQEGQFLFLQLEELDATQGFLDQNFGYCLSMAPSQCQKRMIFPQRFVQQFAPLSFSVDQILETPILILDPQQRIGQEQK